jgi:hypothetical protein
MPKSSEVAQAIAEHIEGWKSASFSWRDSTDPGIAAQNKSAAIEAHAAECLRRIRLALAFSSAVPSGVDSTRGGEHGGPPLPRPRHVSPKEGA